MFFSARDGYTLNHKLSRKTQLFLLGAPAGVAAFLLVHATAPLDVANDAFCRGGYIEKDIQQHYAGWLFLPRQLPGWPLCIARGINYPDRLSVAYTDSIPLLAALLCRQLAAALVANVPVFRLVHAGLLCLAGRVWGAAVLAVCGRVGSPLAGPCSSLPPALF